MSLKPLTIVVGRNNAGKSSLIEALKFIAVSTGVYRTANYRDSEHYCDGVLTRKDRVITPSLKGIALKSDNMFHRYGEPPAIIEAEFGTGSTATAFIFDRKSVYCKICGDDGKMIKSKSDAQTARLPSVSILPPIGPLKIDEIILSSDYVKNSMTSHLVSLHFRNQLNVFYDMFFGRFKKFAEESWDGLRILELEGKGGMHEDGLRLLVRDGDFVADVGEMGHGLQIWLQIVWFLTYSYKADVLILDEPDVYLHADMQRKLIILAKKLNKQIIIATHSLEIIADVEPEDILIVDKRHAKSKYANSLPSVQNIIDTLGSVQNIHLAKLWSMKKCLLTEGKDVKILKHLYLKLYPDAKEPLDTYPIVELGGWSGWAYAIGSQKMVKATGEERICVYCLLDRDYHTEVEIASRLDEANKQNIKLHIWNYKEIEKYLLIPSAITRVINTESSGAYNITESVVTERIFEIAEEIRDGIIDNVAAGYSQTDRRIGPQYINKKAREQVGAVWGKLDTMLTVLPGKDFISQLSGWSQQQYKVSLSPIKISKAIMKPEIHQEVVAFLHQFI